MFGFLALQAGVKMMCVCHERIAGLDVRVSVVAPARVARRTAARGTQHLGSVSGPPGWPVSPGTSQEVRESAPRQRVHRAFVWWG